MSGYHILGGGGGGGSASGFIASVINAGFAFLNRFTLTASEVDAGIAVSATRHTASIEQAPAFAVSLLGASGSSSASVSPAPAVTASLRDVATTGFLVNPALSVAQMEETVWRPATQAPAFTTSLLGVSGTAAREVVNGGLAMNAGRHTHQAQSIPQDPAVEIVRVVYDLNKRQGANVAVNVAGTWTNVTNAQGLHDGSNATSAGGVTSSSRKMRLDYANSVNKGELTITAFNLHFYVSVTGDATGLLSDVVLSYNVGAGEQTLETVAGNFNNLTTPRTYDLFALGVDSWAEFDSLQAFVNHQWAAAATGVTCSVDAIEVEVVASRTDTP